jgi:hypothetical protein
MLLEKSTAEDAIDAMQVKRQVFSMTPPLGHLLSIDRPQLGHLLSVGRPPGHASTSLARAQPKAALKGHAMVHLHAGGEGGGST